MLNELILISFFGGLVALDNTEAFQTMFSQPLVIGPVVGFMLGDVSCGLKIGILLQLMYIWVMPIGTATFPDPATGSVVGSCGFVILTDLFPDRTNLILLVILIFVVFYSIFAGWTLIKQRQFNSKLLPKADLHAERAWIKGFNSLFLLGLSGPFFRGLAVTSAGILCIFVLLKPMVRFLSFIPEGYLQNVELPIWGLGIGTMIHLFGRRKNLTWCLGGAILGITFILL
jgi:mannose/fructose/N-acetylgalactosamine-specific phosphotransferase system component IIC